MRLLRRIDPGTVLVGGIGAGALAVALSWWHSDSAPSATGGAVDSAARLTGLLAGYAGVVLLGLMARVPLLERRVGRTRLMRCHAAGGRLVVALALGHGVLAVVRWTAQTPGSLPHRLIGPVPHDRALLDAVIALALLVVVGALSARAARRRLGHAAWQGVHLTTYLAVALGLGHQLAGPDLGVGTPARTAWYVLYTAVAALLIHYRVLTPLRQLARHRLRVLDVLQEAPGVVSVQVTGRHLGELGARPGQFLRWRFLARGLWWTSHPYSLSAPAQEELLRITVKDAGRHSHALALLRPGTRVIAQGPYGSLVAQRDAPDKVLLLGGGIGVAPLLALLETLPGEITLVYRARTAQDLVLRGECDDLAEVRGTHRTRVLYSVGDQPEDSLPLTGRALRAAIPDLPAHLVYLAGPPGMVAAARRALRRAGVPGRRIRCESFDF